MSELLLSLRTYFKTKYVIIDNNLCRLHYKASVAILLAFSILVTAKQYIGDPIDCVVPKDHIDTKMLDTYCWIHKTFSVDKSFKGDLGSEVAYPGVAPHTPGDKLVYHSYYQWVCFVLFLQAIAFYIPRFLWKLLEGNRVHHLSDGLANPVLDNKDRKKQIMLLVDYMETNKKSHKWYLLAMISVEVLYFLNVLVQMYVMDVFLGGQFSTYGWKVLSFTEWHWEARYDPMIKVFPRMAKCTFRMYGTSGDIQKLDAVCILPINIINEKIYVFLWFWFVGLAFVTAAWLVYRTATVMLYSMRYWLMSRKARTLDDDILRDVCEHTDAGDWFIIYQISKNIDPLHLKYFMEEYGVIWRIPKALELKKIRDEQEKQEAELERLKKLKELIKKWRAKKEDLKEAESKFGHMSDAELADQS